MKDCDLSDLVKVDAIKVKDFLVALPDVIIPFVPPPEELDFDGAFLSSIAWKTMEWETAVESRYDALLKRYGIPPYLFCMDSRYEARSEYLSFWKNENALSDMLSLLILKSAPFWKAFHGRVTGGPGRTNYTPDSRQIKIGREMHIDDQRRKRSDIKISYFDENGELGIITIEHKINHEFTESQLNSYMEASKHGSNNSFCLITSKFCDVKILKKMDNANKNGYDHYDFMTHHQLLKLLFKSCLSSFSSIHAVIVQWLFEITKYFCSDDLIKQTIGAPFAEYSEGFWEKHLFLTIIGELKNDQ